VGPSTEKEILQEKGFLLGGVRPGRWLKWGGEGGAADCSGKKK